MPALLFTGLSPSTPDSSGDQLGLAASDGAKPPASWFVALQGMRQAGYDPRTASARERTLHLYRATKCYRGIKERGEANPRSSGPAPERGEMCPCFWCCSVRPGGGLLSAPSFLLMLRWSRIGSIAMWCVALCSLLVAILGGIVFHVLGLVALLFVEALICASIDSTSDRGDPITK